MLDGGHINNLILPKLSLNGACLQIRAHSGVLERGHQAAPEELEQED